MIEWSAEHEQMRAALRRFVENEIAPRRDALEFGDLAPYGILREMFAAFGLDDLAKERFQKAVAPRASSAPNRRDVDAVAAVLLPIIELSRCSPGLVTAMGVSANLAPGAILKRGTREQKERWALDLMTMEKVGAWALTEPGSGSDAFGGMRSTARPDGTDFVLNGTKTFITNGPHADTIILLCKLDSGAECQRMPVVTFILDRGMPGLQQSKPLRKMGMHSSPTGELFLADVRVGIDRLLGGEAALERTGSTASRSTSAARGAFASERASIAATALGIISRCLEMAVDYARTRVQFGKRIGDFQLIQEKLARMEVCRLNIQNLIFYYIESLTSGRGITFAEASAMKLYSARAAVEVSNDALQIFGGNGYMGEIVIEQLARDARVLQIYAGTDEMQITGIARSMLGDE